MFVSRQVSVGAANGQTTTGRQCRLEGIENDDPVQGREHQPQAMHRCQERRNEVQWHCRDRL